MRTVGLVWTPIHLDGLVDPTFRGRVRVCGVGVAGRRRPRVLRLHGPAAQVRGRCPDGLAGGHRPDARRQPVDGGPAAQLDQLAGRRRLERRRRLEHHAAVDAHPRVDRGVQDHHERLQRRMAPQRRRPPQRGHAVGDQHVPGLRLRLPGVKQWDITLSKNWFPVEGLRVQFRADFINAFNTVQFDPGSIANVCPGNPSCVAAGNRFGQLTSTRAPREISSACGWRGAGWPDRTPPAGGAPDDRQAGQDLRQAGRRSPARASGRPAGQKLVLSRFRGQVSASGLALPS